MKGNIGAVYYQGYMKIISHEALYNRFFNLFFLTGAKACVLYFYIFHENKAVNKFFKMFFSFSRYSNLYNFFFPSFFPCQPLLNTLVKLIKDKALNV